MVGFTGRVQNHGCFDATYHAGTRSAGQFMQQLAQKVSESNDVSTMQRSSMQSLMMEASEQVRRVSNYSCGLMKTKLHFRFGSTRTNSRSRIVSVCNFSKYYILYIFVNFVNTFSMRNTNQSA